MEIINVCTIKSGFIRDKTRAFSQFCDQVTRHKTNQNALLLMILKLIRLPE